MAADSGKVRDAAAPPFATRDGKPTTTGGKGGRDFLTDYKGGDNDGGGGMDVTAMSRPQKAATAQAGLPNKQSIPEGGKILLADPGKVSGSPQGGGRGQQTPSTGPFKGLK